MRTPHATAHDGAGAARQQLGRFGVVVGEMARDDAQTAEGADAAALEITADRGRSRQVMADHGRSRQITADRGRAPRTRRDVRRVAAPWWAWRRRGARGARR